MRVSSTQCKSPAAKKPLQSIPQTETLSLNLVTAFYSRSMKRILRLVLAVFHLRVSRHSAKSSRSQNPHRYSNFCSSSSTPSLNRICARHHLKLSWQSPRRLRNIKSTPRYPSVRFFWSTFPDLCEAKFTVNPQLFM